MTAPTVPTDLARLAEMRGVQLAYRDVDDVRRAAAPEALVAVLRALGEPIERPGDAAPALRAAEGERWHRDVEPVVASFEGREVAVDLRVPAEQAEGRAAVRLTLERGELRRWTEDLATLERVDGAEVGGRRYVALRLPVRDLPDGYHTLEIERGGEALETLLVVAPPRAYAPWRERREWGAFLPLHALRTERSWGAGDLTDLGGLAAWTRELGASHVGTLPLLPVYLGGRTSAEGGAEEPFDPSPYSPVSRLLWNELVIDPRRAPELGRCAGVADLLASAELEREVGRLRRGHHVDYRALADLKGRVLRALAGCFYEAAIARHEDLDRLIAQRPEIASYARFRGVVARHGSRWWEWPTGVGDGELRAGDAAADVERLHLYAQLLAHDQVGTLATELRAGDQHLYLDLPIGARRDGFDVWRERDLFVLDADTGAPPDTIFTGGQNWGFPPLHPQALRQARYGYLRSVLVHHMALADALRIDHVMGLHRLFWIPDGFDAADGVYVRYPADEWYAIVNLESHRHRTRVVGEDLGTVPDHVEEALQERGIARMYVVQYEAAADRDDVLEPVPDDSVASLNTHDMPPFAAWWSTRDLDEAVALGHLDEEEAAADREERATIRRRLTSLLEAEGRIADGAEDPGEVLSGLLEWLADSPAPLLLVGLEDLWLEVEPQNIPGTADERPNWRRRAALTLEGMREREDVVGVLRRVDAARHGTSTASETEA